MACVDTDGLNQLVIKFSSKLLDIWFSFLRQYATAEEGKVTVTLKYGLYINWGRPNHNPSRIENVASILKTKGFGVQFEHDKDGEHYVALIVDGEEVCLYI